MKLKEACDLIFDSKIADVWIKVQGKKEDLGLVSLSYAPNCVGLRIKEDKRKLFTVDHLYAKLHILFLKGTFCLIAKNGKLHVSDLKEVSVDLL